MPKRQVFFSFKYADDFARVNQIRNMGAIEGDSIVSDNEWEEVKQSDEKIKQWIHKQMDMRSCVIVCIGQNTDASYYCNYEIEYAWKQGKGIVGIYIHNLNDLNGQKTPRGNNPFGNFKVIIDGKEVFLSEIVATHDPMLKINKDKDNFNSYQDIREHLEEWIEEAIKLREIYGKDIAIKPITEQKKYATKIEIINPPKQWISKN